MRMTNDFKKRLKAVIKEIAKKRDEIRKEHKKLRDLLSECEDIDQSVQEGLEGMEDAIDRMSAYL